jgi:hypothetical protein
MYENPLSNRVPTRRGPGDSPAGTRTLFSIRTTFRVGTTRPMLKAGTGTPRAGCFCSHGLRHPQEEKGAAGRPTARVISAGFPCLVIDLCVRLANEADGIIRPSGFRRRVVFRVLGYREDRIAAGLDRGTLGQAERRP